MSSPRPPLTTILITAFFSVRALCQDSSSTPTPSSSVSSSSGTQAATTPLTSAATYIVTSVITPSNSAATTSTVVDSNATQSTNTASSGGISSAGHQGLTAGEIAAIVVCLVVAVLGGLALGFWLARRRRKNKPAATPDDAEKDSGLEKNLTPMPELPNNAKPLQEADGNALLEMDAPRPELEGKEEAKVDAPLAELEGTEPNHIKNSLAELEGDHADPKFSSLKEQA